MIKWLKQMLLLNAVLLPPMLLFPRSVPAPALRRAP